MAQSDHNFVVKNGLEVAGNTTLGGTLSYNNIALPASDGTAGQVIVTDGSGALSFASVTTNAFSAIAVNGQTTITTDQVGDTLSFIGGTGIALTTDAPSDALTITVDANTDEVTEGSTNLYHTAARAVTAIEGSTNLSVNGGLIYADTATAYVGIGDTSPQGKLDVAGNILVNGTEIISSSGNIADASLTVGGSIEGPLSNVTMQYGSSYTGTPIQGSFWFDSLNQKTKVYTGSAWVDAVPAGSGGGGDGGSATDANATFSKYTYSISSTTSAVSGADDNSNTLSYVVDDSQNVEVFVNGIKQVEGSANDYVATTGSAVTFTYNLTSGSVVDIQVYELLTADSFYLKTETYTQPQVNAQITTALGDYVPAAGGTFTGDVQINSDELKLYNAVNTNNTYIIAENTGAGNAGLRLKNNQGEWIIVANDRLRFIDEDSSTERLSILSNGNVGIGTTSPDEKLHIKSGGNAYKMLKLEAETGSGDAGILLQGDGGNQFSIQQPGGAAGLFFYDRTAGQYRIFIDPNGKVGIGDTTPSEKLDVNGNIRLPNLASGGGITFHNNREFQIAATDDGTYSHDKGLIISTLDYGSYGISMGIHGSGGLTNNLSNFTPQLRIDNTGNVGIGTESPTAKLNVVGTSAEPGISIKSGGNGSVDPFKVTWSGGTEGSMFIVDDNGNVGINELSPSHRLHINGGNNDQARVRVTNTANGQASLDLDNGEGYFRTYTDAGEYRIYDQTDADHRLIIDTSGNVAIGLTSNIGSKFNVNSEMSLGPDNNNRMIIGSTSGGVGSIGTIEGGTASFSTMTFKGSKVGIGVAAPTEQLHLYKEVTNGGHHTYMKLQQFQSDLWGIGQQGSFIDFDFQDTNDNHRPQVQIGAELGNKNEGDLGQISEGRGNFVVKTTDGASPYGPAYGTSATEVFRVTYDGYINAKGAVINSKKIQSSTGTNSTNTGAVVVAATAITMTKRNHDQSRFLYSVTLSHETDGAVTNTNGFLRLEYRISSLGQTSFTSLNQTITVGGMSDYSGGTNNNSFQIMFTPPNFNKNETIEMRLVFNKSNAQSVYFNQQNLTSQPSGSSNHALGYVLEMGL